MAKGWKIVTSTERLGGGPPLKEYFLVAVPDRYLAIATLRKRRTDLLNVPCDVVGEADEKLLDWLDVQANEVFCVLAVS
jgi:hypothetical protein